MNKKQTSRGVFTTLKLAMCYHRPMYEFFTDFGDLRCLSLRSVALRASVALFSMLFALTASFFFVSQNAFAVTQSEVDEAKASLDEAKDAAADAAEDYYQAEDAHDAAIKKMDETEKKIDDAQDELDTKQDRLSNRAVSMYRDGSVTFLDVLLGSSSFSQFITIWDALNILNDNDAQLIADVKSLKADLEASYKEYADAEKEAKDQMEKAKKAKEKYQAKADEFQSIYNNLSAELQAQVAAAYAAEEEALANNDIGDDDNNDSDNNNNNNNNSSSSSSSSSSYVNNGGSGVCNVGLAMSLVGCAYTAAGNSPSEGFDCSGLCYYCGAPYRSSAALVANAKSKLPVSEAQAGDVLWMSGHVGIYCGGGQVVEALDSDHGVVLSSVSGKWVYALRF